jgi:hypothetical protein
MVAQWISMAKGTAGDINVTVGSVPVSQAPISKFQTFPLPFPSPRMRD